MSPRQTDSDRRLYLVGCLQGINNASGGWMLKLHLLFLLVTAAGWFTVGRDEAPQPGSQEGNDCRAQPRILMLGGLNCRPTKRQPVRWLG
jgi:hypothetical protein